MCGIGSSAELKKLNRTTYVWQSIGTFNPTDSATSGIRYSFVKIPSLNLKSGAASSSVVILESDGGSVIAFRQYFENQKISPLKIASSNSTPVTILAGTSLWSGALQSGYAMFAGDTSKLFYVGLGADTTITGKAFWQ